MMRYFPLKLSITKTAEEYGKRKSEEDLSLNKIHIKKLFRQYCFYVHKRTVEAGNDNSLPAGILYGIRDADSRFCYDSVNMQMQGIGFGCTSCLDCGG